MTWRNNALGIGVDSTMDVDFTSIKSASVIDFVTINIGTGLTAAPAWVDQYNKAVAAGFPVLLDYEPYPSMDDYTFDGMPTEEINFLKKQLGGRAFQALVISVDRYWVGTDLETNHNPVRPATNMAIAHTAEMIVRTMTQYLAGRNISVLVRTNDNFVQKYAQPMTSWTDSFGMYLADWRYRMRDESGAYNKYVVYSAVPTPLPTYSHLVDLLPPDDAKNPLIPGNAPLLRFWEFSGDRFQLPFVRTWKGDPSAARFVLFNGSFDSMKVYLMGVPSGSVPVPVPLPVPTPAPVPIPDPLEARLARLEAIAAALAKVLSDYKPG